MGHPKRLDPGPVQEKRVLVEALGVSVADFRCRVAVHREGAEEPHHGHHIAFVRRGLFVCRSHGTAVTADANHVVFFNDSETSRYAHPVAGGDDCTVMRVPPALALELIARHAPRDAEDARRPFRVPYALAGQQLVALHYEVLRLARQAALTDGGRLSLEDALASLMNEAVAAAYSRRPEPGATRAARAAAAGRHLELAETIKAELNAHLASPPSLVELAAQLGCSPFHLSRTFARVTGMSLRAYLGHLRTRAAAEQLARGESDLTELALELGYGDHSHFTNAFRQAFGVPPSVFRERQRIRRDVAA